VRPGVRLARQGKPPRIEGHGAVFNKWSLPIGSFREQIMPGAFAKTVQRPEGVAGGVDAVYWTEPTTGGVWALRDMVTAAAPVASSQDRPRGLVTDGGYVYWTTAGSKAGADGAVWRAPHGTAAAVQIVGQQNVGGLGRLAVDGERVYWLNVDGADHALMAAPLGGGAPEMLAVGPGGQVFDVAVDEQRVYWTASDGVDGRVLSVEKR